MKFVIGRIAFDKAVNLVSKALPSKDYGDATSGIMMSIEEGGSSNSTKKSNKKSENLNKIVLIANSLEVFIRTELKLTDGDFESGVVIPNGNTLYKIVSNLKSLKNPIECSFEDEGEMNLICGSDYNGSITTYDSMSFHMPIDNEEIESLPTISLPVRLIKKAIDEVAFSCSKDKTNIQLTGVYFHQTKDGMNIVGTDSLRMSVISFKSKLNNPQSIILSVNHLQLLKKVFDELEIKDSETVKLHISEDMAYFVHEGTTIGFQSYGSNYYDEYANLITPSDDCATVIKFKKDEFIEKLNLAVSHNNSNSDTIVISLQTKSKAVFENKEGTSSNTFSVPFNLTGMEGESKKFSVSVNPQYLYDVLSKLKEKEIKLGLVDRTKGPITIYPIGEKETGDYTHLFSVVD